MILANLMIYLPRFLGAERPSNIAVKVAKLNGFTDSLCGPFAPQFVVSGQFHRGRNGNS
jgi:hypothetical protein